MKDISESIKTDLKLLLNIKRSIGLLNNSIHDKAALLAINILEKKYPTIKFYYKGAGAGGIDIIGKIKNKTLFIGEVKTTTIDTTTLHGQQIRAIEKDLIRLKNNSSKYKYLILIDEKVEKNLRRRLDFKDKFRNINILTVL